MRILQICPQVPFPLSSGGRICTFNTTKYLALRGHEITMIALGKCDVEQTSAMSPYCRLITVGVETVNRVHKVIGNLFTRMPYTMSKYYSSSVETAIAEFLQTESVDVVHVENLHMAWYGPYAKKRCQAPTFLRQQNAEHIIWERFYRTQANPIKRLYGFLQFKRVKQFEADYCEAFDRVIAITSEDRERILQIAARAQVTVVPAGVDDNFYSPKAARVDSKEIVFVGSMDWVPNRDAALWFAKKILPRIVAKLPEAKLKIVGSNPRSDVLQLTSSSIEIIANAPDVRDYLAAASVVVVPLRIGGGMRLKILEAFAMRKAVVSTGVGCEGIGVLDRRELLIADTAEMFAERVVEVLNNVELRQKLESCGYEKIMQSYRWERIAEQFEAVYEEVLREKGIAIRQSF